MCSSNTITYLSISDKNPNNYAFINDPNSDYFVFSVIYKKDGSNNNPHYNSSSQEHW